MLTAEQLISLLALKPHPEEGGHYRETYRAAESVSVPGAPGTTRAVSTAIYYLLTESTFSAMHRLASDEIFHFYLGDPVEMLQLRPDGSGEVVVLGADLAQGMKPQIVVPRGVWQGSRLRPGGTLALLGCTVAPGFDFADYEGGDREALQKAWPAHRDRIARLTR